MAGAGASYGFDALTDLGERLVSAARAGDVATLLAIQQAIDDYLARVVVKYV